MRLDVQNALATELRAQPNYTMGGRGRGGRAREWPLMTPLIISAVNKLPPRPRHNRPVTVKVICTTHALFKGWELVCGVVRVV